MAAKITAVVGTYRREGVIARAVEEVLEGARERGAEAETVLLIDKQIAFCDNCRACTQKPGPRRGACHMRDDMDGILDSIDASDGIVLASPMNFWTVTAVMKRFIERLIPYGYWPWGAPAPKNRIETFDKRAVIVVSSAAPALIARLFSPIVSLLGFCAKLAGARVVGVLVIGLAARKPHVELSARQVRRARLLGRRLAGPEPSPWLPSFAAALLAVAVLAGTLAAVLSKLLPAEG